LSVPSGKTPSAISLFTSSVAAALIVPSPPPATIILGLRSIAALTSSLMFLPVFASLISMRIPAASKYLRRSEAT
jgi:hypothetical protein